MDNKPKDDKAERESAEALGGIFSGIIAAADKERKASESYKDLFTTSETLDGLLRALELKMTDHVLNATTILKEKYGYDRTPDEAFMLLLALPFLANRLENYIEKTEGSACCVDKTYYVLAKNLRSALEAGKVAK